MNTVFSCSVWKLSNTETEDIESSKNYITLRPKYVKINNPTTELSNIPKGAWEKSEKHYQMHYSIINMNKTEFRNPNINKHNRKQNEDSNKAWEQLQDEN